MWRPSQQNGKKTTKPLSYDLKYLNIHILSPELEDYFCLIIT